MRSLPCRGLARLSEETFEDRNDVTGTARCHSVVEQPLPCTSGVDIGSIQPLQPARIAIDLCPVWHRSFNLLVKITLHLLCEVIAQFGILSPQPPATAVLPRAVQPVAPSQQDRSRNSARPRSSNNSPSFAPRSATSLAGFCWPRYAADACRCCGALTLAGAAALSRLGGLSFKHFGAAALGKHAATTGGFVRSAARVLLTSRILGRSLGPIALAMHGSLATLGEISTE